MRPRGDPHRAIIGAMSLRVGELPRVPVVGVRVRTAAVARFAGIRRAPPTSRATSAGSATTRDLGVSLVWPLYGVAVLWMATGDRRTWPWDVLGLVVATATLAARQRRDGPARSPSPRLLAVVAGAAWVARCAGWRPTSGAPAASGR